MKPYILITIVIISSLINCNYFGATTLAAYFFYTVAIAIASLYTWLPLFKIKQPVLIAYPLPIYCFILLTLFYIVHSYFNAFFDVRLFLLIGNCLLLISNSILINTKAININKLFKIISILAFIESLVCICQYIKLVPSLNMYFPVTGTWGNPNVIAIFLAMALPSTISLLFFSSYKNKCLGLVMLPFIGFAIVILKCRTAYIGAIITAVMITSFYYASIFNLNTFLKSFKVLAVIILSIACLSILSFFLYKMKLASADGRVFIWKISSRLVQYYPISGVGLGNFEQAYNLQQANYFNNEAFTKTEVLNASFINMAYNDFLQHAVEGGFIGLILFLGLLISLLVKRHQFNKETSHIVFSYIGITSFTTMCFFNFMMEAVPVVCLFVIYAAVIVSTKREPQSISNNKIVFYLYKQLVLKQGAKILLLSVFAIVSVNFLFKQLISAKAFAVNNQVTTEIRTGNFSTAIEMLDDYKEALADNDTYWMNYGKALMHQKKYSEALVKFDKAKQLTSNPDLYILMGKCNMLLQQYTNAEQLFGIAKGIYPSKIQPTYELMLLYLKKEDYQSAFKKANEIITLVPKVTSPQTIFYKAQAYKTVQEINTKNISITSKTTK